MANSGTQYIHFSMSYIVNMSQSNFKCPVTLLTNSVGLITLWLRYARWEEAQHDFVRARSVF
jgi:hypothetical protein